MPSQRLSLHRRIVLGALLGTIGLAPSLQAQDAKPGSIDALLHDLAKSDGKAWDTRVGAMRKAAGEASKGADQYRERATAKGKAAAAQRGRAEELRAEIGKLTELQQLLATLTFEDPNGEQHLERTLASLRKMPGKSWQTRIATMTARAERHAAEAKALATEEQQLRKTAADSEARGKQLLAEVDKLGKLRKLLGSMQLELLAEAAPAAAGGMPVAKAMAANAPAAMKAKPKSQPKSPPKAQPKAQPKAPAATKEKAKPKPKPKAKPDGKTKPEEMAKATPKTAPAAAKATPAKTDEPRPPEQLLTYADDVFPIFDEHCLGCHDAGDASGGLDLSTHANALVGGSSGRTLVPGDPDRSRLYLLVSHQEKPTMPPDEAPIDRQLIAKIQQWIQQGAPKDIAEARRLQAARAKKAKERAAKAAAQKAAPKREAIMPGDLPRIAKRYPERVGAMRAIASSPVAPLLAVPGHGQVLLLHADNLRELGVLPFAPGNVERLCFSADGGRLLAAGGTAGQRGGAVLFDVRTGEQLGHFGERKDVVVAAALSPDGELAAVGGTRRRVLAVRAADGNEQWAESHDEWVTAIAFSPDGKRIASADRAGFVQVREASTGNEEHKFKAADGTIADLAFAPDSATLAVAGGDRYVTMWRMRDGRRTFRQRAHSDAVLAVDWRGSSRLLSSGADGRILHWRTNGRRERDLPRAKDWIYDLAVGNDGKRAFSVDWLGRVSAIDVGTGKLLQSVSPLTATP